MTHCYYQNHYRCTCGEHWTTEWDSTCDDRCPTCNISCSPHTSFETGLALALYAARDMYNDRWRESINTGDPGTPRYCEIWGEECLTIVDSFPDSPVADELKKLAIDFTGLADRLRADGYGV